MLDRLYTFLFPVLAALFFFFMLLPLRANAFDSQHQAEPKKSFGEILYLSAPAEAVGFTHTIDLIIQAYQDIGYRVEVVPMPAKRAMHEAVHGEWVDGVVGRAEMAAEILNHFIRIPVAIGQVEIFAYFRQDAEKELAAIDSWAQLSRYQVATLRGFILSSQNLSKHRVKFQQVTYARQAFEMLVRKHVDFVVLPRKMAEQVLKNGEFRQIGRSVNALDKKPLFHYLHQKHDKLVPALTGEESPGSNEQGAR